MYAIIADSGRQFKVEAGQELQINFRDLKAGDPLEFDQVLAVRGDGDAKIGSPTLAGAVVRAEVLGAVKGEKVFIQKFRRRKNSKRRTGHRQIYTRVKITAIEGA